MCTTSNFLTNMMDIMVEMVNTVKMIIMVKLVILIEIEMVTMVEVFC